ncbi:hypothetical protein BUALT_Bualt17G0084200 [Buddleja alternifolia]|uniref:Protein BIG GRAIN 1-like E n=1 Tax=Buddleja alternifolia TaxID=168488 RepID=A0AAV6W715_9LAMI|nr:hypothetical protein BUALT_Bualt17G0084200 [Buddleja alternifolia]
MSLTGRSSNPNKIHKNSSSHWRNNSGELDVFEAARYFSGANENPGTNQKFIREENKKYYHPTARMSLDMPMRINPIYPQNNHHGILDQKQIMVKENKKYKQPSSPGGRLAHFLNSLFNQNNSKKKKKSKSGDTSNKDNVDQEQSPGGRRKRRISISHFRITNSDSINDLSKSSGFRTPPPYANTPTKSCRDFRSFLDQQKDKNDEKIRVSNILKNKEFELSEERKLFRNFIHDDDDQDDGGDSDSSSDLFDLPNHELDFYSSGLPVYETTHMDRIRIGAV